MTYIKKVERDESIIICTHCHREITTFMLKGMSLVCPYCNRPIDEAYNYMESNNSSALVY